MNIWNKIINLHSEYKSNNIEQELYEFFTQETERSTQDLPKKVLVQCVEDPFYYLLFGQIISDLRKDKNIEASQYIVRNFSVGSYQNFVKYCKSKLHYNRWKDKKWTTLYSSYCDMVAYSNEEYIGIWNEVKLFLNAVKIKKSLSSKEELVALKSDNIIIGDLVYDTYLRFKPAPTVDIKDFFLTIVIWKALKNIFIAKRYFDHNKPDIVLQSYSTYIQHGITARVGLGYGIGVYTFGNYQNAYKQLEINDDSHVANSKNYKNDFVKLQEKELKLLEAKNALDERLEGVIDRVTFYMKESAYKSTEERVPNVKNSVILFLHDFYDSPHIYDSMIFADFLEWVEFSIKALDRNNISYFLKPHPNQLPDSAQIVEALQKKYPHIKIISPKITNKQLVDAGISAGLTVYGTVAHELAYMGIPIVTCGNNPHSSYSFCYEAKNKSEYSQMLHTILELKYDNKSKIQEEVKSFYYMHNLNYSEEEKEFSVLLNNLRSLSSLNNEFPVKEISKKMDKLRHNNAYMRFIKEVL